MEEKKNDNQSQTEEDEMGLKEFLRNNWVELLVLLGLAVFVAKNKKARAAIEKLLGKCKDQVKKAVAKKKK